MSRRKNRIDDHAEYAPYFGNELDWIRLTTGPIEVGASADDIPGGGDRWSTWDQSQASERGPQPYPDWLVTELAAVDHELGVLKTGKEADVHLLRREVPDGGRSCLLAAKRYRDDEHRQFHRSAVYQEGRRTRRTRDARAMHNRSAFGRQLLAGHWARAEFDALALLHQLGSAVPYPVQIVGTEILLEFIGEPDGSAAPRLSEWPGRGAELAGLWEQAVELMVTLAGAGYAHGDLSAFNLLVHRDRLVMIDLPQLVDVVGNPQGPSFLDRDASTVAGWFTRHGHPADVAALLDRLHSEARIR
ncbi:MAG TPA: RIO1 family regulatory kinase/ATPase [Mycobacteriales bacterium]